MIAQEIEREICAVLRGEQVQPFDGQSFARMAVDEGVGPLILQSLDRSTQGELQEEMRRQLALAAVREGELRRLLRAFGDAGADVLLIKGAHLAYSVYADPALRPRNDTDILVRPGHEHAARRPRRRLPPQ